MERESLYKILYFIAGSLVIGSSSGFGMLYAFQSNFLVVYTCFIGFLAGYKVVQVGVHNGSDSIGIFIKKLEWLRNMSAFDWFTLIFGSGFISAGFVMLSKSMIGLEVVYSATSAVFIGSGYILAHWTVNNTLM